MRKMIPEAEWTPYYPHLLSRLPEPFNSMQLVMRREDGNGWHYRKPTEWETIKLYESKA